MKIICRKEYLIEPLRHAFPDAAISASWDQHDANIVISDPQELTADNLQKIPSLAFIHGARAGYDAADLQWIREHKIPFCNARGLYSIPIAEDVVCKILTYTTNAWQYQNLKSMHEYRATAERRCLSSYTVGFLGTGSIADAAAERLSAFGCRVIGYKRSPVAGMKNFEAIYSGEKQLDEFLAECDILVLAVDLNAQTYHMMDAEQLAKMRDGAALINIARGSVLNEAALIEALQRKKLGFAALDVFEQEPLPKKSPLWELPQVVITPHAAGLCKENHEHLARLVVENIQRFQSGQALNNLVE